TGSWLAQQQVYSARSCKRRRSAPVFSRAEINDIAGWASTIDERRLGICVVEQPADEAAREQVGARLTAWRQSAAAGDSALCARRLRLLGPEARSALQRSLLVRLSTVLGRGLFSDFVLFRHLFRDAAQPFWSPDSRRVYDSYLAAWRGGRGRDFFLGNPVSAR